MSPVLSPVLSDEWVGGFDWPQSLVSVAEMRACGVVVDEPKAWRSAAEVSTKDPEAGFTRRGQRSYGWRRVRYRGLLRNGAHLHLLCTTMTLRRAERLLA